MTAAFPPVRGAIHVHSVASDGTGTPDEIAAAAARAGLDFVVLTDHGNGTREPMPPRYLAGVLCLDGVEISTNGGHYLALDLPQAPYPLGGEPSAVVEDVRRLGGFGIAAHPGSPKPELQWRDPQLPVDALEWLNADSEWRDELWEAMSLSLLTYPWRPVETLVSLLDRPGAVLKQWAARLATQRVVAVAGVDAHARLGLGSHDSSDRRIVARVPSYDTAFRAFSLRAELDAAFSGDPSRDAAQLLAALRAGRVFTTIDGLAVNGSLDATASTGGAAARIGDYVEPAGAVVIDARVAAPRGSRVSLMREDGPVYETMEPAFRVDVGTEPAAYWLEVQLPGTRVGESVPWLLSNPFYVGLRAEHARHMVPPPSPLPKDGTPLDLSGWQAEVSPGSRSVLVAAGNGTATAWHYALHDGPPAQQYAAVHIPLADRLQAGERFGLRVRSDRPCRIWLQLRAPGGVTGRRWGTTFYVDQVTRDVVLPSAEFRGLEPGITGSSLPREEIDALLLVADLVNHRPGDSAIVQVERLLRY